MAIYKRNTNGTIVPLTITKTEESLLKEQIKQAGLELPVETTCSKVNLANLKETAALAVATI